MAKDFVVETEVLVARLHELIGLHDEVETTQKSVQGERERQSAHQWSVADPASMFADQACMGVDALDAVALELRAAIKACHEALQANSDAVVLADEQVMAHFATLAAYSTADTHVQTAAQTAAKNAAEVAARGPAWLAPGYVRPLAPNAPVEEAAAASTAPGADASSGVQF